MNLDRSRSVEHRPSAAICAAILAFAAFIVTTACTPANTGSSAAEPKRYELRGKVISVDRAGKKAEIDHEAIPGFMPRMTMTFPVREDWVWEDLRPGVDIRAELVVDNSADEPYWLEKIGIIALPNPNDPIREPKQPEQIGKQVPDIRLTNQDGKRFSLRDFRGRTLALTFIYRECPLADFCIKMSRNFSDLAVQLNTDPELRDKVRLLSISFDPERDTPAKLREYGIGYMGNPEKPDFTVWQLAVGSEKEVRAVADFFGLKYEIDEQDAAQFNHSLVTAVVAPDGKVARILPGNRWSPEDLLREIRSAGNSE